MQNNYNVYNKLKDKPIWNPVTQRLVYDSITNKVDLTDCHILDLGCGKGDFATYLQEKEIWLSYHVGVDLFEHCINEFLLNIHYSGLPSASIIDNFLRTGFFEDYDDRILKCDYALALASLEIMETGKGEHLAKVFDLMDDLWNMVSKGFVIATQSCLAPDQSDGSWYAEPMVMWEYVRQNFTTRIQIDHTYAPHFFTLIVLKGQTEWEQLEGYKKSALKGVL